MKSSRHDMTYSRHDNCIVCRKKRSVTLGEMGCYVSLVYSSTFLCPRASSIYHKHSIRPLAYTPCIINALYGGSSNINTGNTNSCFKFYKYAVPNCLCLSLSITFSQ